MKKILIALLVFIYSTTSIAQNQSKNTSLKNRIDSLLQTYFSDSLPGASVAIVNNNTIFFQKSYGISNIHSKEKISASSDFNICSLTKQFTAIAILQLEEKHLLSLQDKIIRFFPDMAQHVANTVTVKELLTHSSGIIDHYDYTNTTGMHHAHNADVYNAIKNIDSTYFVPGTQFRYSNTAYCLLALIVEKLSGLSFNDYMEKNIFKPAGMLHTTIWNEGSDIHNETTGYDYDSSSKSFIQSGPGEHIFFSTEGDGGIYTSTNDYIKWFKALQSGKIFSRKIVTEARSIEFTISEKQKAGYGFGWFIDENGQYKKVYHSGDNGGFRTYSFTIPSLNYMIVIFANRSDINIEDIVQKIYHLQWPDATPFINIEVLTS